MRKMIVLLLLLSAVAEAAPRIQIGLLSPESSASPAEIARAFANDPSLRTIAVHGFRDGAGVRMQQTYGALDVIGGDVAVRVDGRGRVRWMTSSEAAIPDGFSSSPDVSAADALASVWHGPRIDESHQTRLAILAVPGATPRLVWIVRLPADPIRLAVIEWYVDAHTGAPLWARNLARQVNGTVFPTNPAKSTTQEEPLDNLDSTATHLDGPDILGRNCIDNSDCPIVTPLGNVRWCDVQPKAAPTDPAGDFDYSRPAADTAPEDEFSEVQMYYHTTVALDRFRQLGFTNLSQRPMTAVVNVRIPMVTSIIQAICSGPTSTVPLMPFDNAAYMPAGTLDGFFPSQNEMVFGQGTTADFAYDGDVVQHEFTHAVMGTLTPNLVEAFPDATGLDTTMGGMMEGDADFWSCTISGDPDVGEYAGPGLTGSTGPIRTLVNGNHFPEDIDGESHDNSSVWSAALWEIRALSTDTMTMDGALYAAMAMLGDMDDMAAAADKVVAELGTAFDQNMADMARAKFDARGITDATANRVYALGSGDGVGRAYLYGTDVMPTKNPVPGPAQYQITLAEPANEIDVAIAQTAVAGLSTGIGGPTAPKIGLLAKVGDTPIAWDPTKYTVESLPSGDVTIATDGSASGKVMGTFPAGTVTLQLTNAGLTVFTQSIVFTAKSLAASPDAGTGAPDAGTGGSKSGGCGCVVSGGGATGAIWIGALAFLIVVTVRRRR
jgi:MYXO-CTERM domain-containing protein